MDAISLALEAIQILRPVRDDTEKMTTRAIVRSTSQAIDGLFMIVQILNEAKNGV